MTTMEQDKFSLFKRLMSFSYAFNGLKILFKEEHNSRIHFVATVAVLILGIISDLNTYEWTAIIFSIGFVITTEIINTAIENIADFISVDKNENIKKIKDLSAAAVLISALTALSIGLIVFIPKVKFWQKLKRQLIIAVFIFLTMTFVNLIGGIVNSNVGHFQGNLSDFVETMEMVAIFCGLYLLTSLIKSKHDTNYRLPIIRTIFWTLMVTLDLIYRSENDFYTVDYLLALVNGGLCLFYNTLLFKVYNGGTGNTYLEIYGFGIIAFAIYELIIIKSSTIITDKILNKKLLTNANWQSNRKKNAL